MTASKKQIYPSNKAQIYELEIDFWFMRRKRRVHRSSWAVSVWDTPEDLMKHGGHTISRLRKEFKIKPEHGPHITDVRIVQHLSRSQLSLDDHRRS